MNDDQSSGLVSLNQNDHEHVPNRHRPEVRSFHPAVADILSRYSRAEDMFFHNLFDKRLVRLVIGEKDFWGRTRGLACSRVRICGWMSFSVAIRDVSVVDVVFPLLVVI